MRYRATLILVAAVGVAALFFFFVEQPRHAKNTERDARAGRLIDVRPADVRAVTIVRPEFTIVVERTPNTWKLSSPVADNADVGAVNALVQTVCDAAVEARFDADGPRLLEYGLDRPAAALRFEGEGGRDLLELRIGDLNPSKTGCYGAREGAREVLLLPAGLRRYALRSLFDFREKRIIGVPTEAVARIEIGAGAASSSWIADGSGGWYTIQDHDTIRGDPTAVGNIVREIRGLRAKDILSEEARRDARRRFVPAGTVSLVLNTDSTRISLAFSKLYGDSCLVETSESERLAVVDTMVLDLFRRTTDDLRDRRLLNYDPSELARLTLETQQRTVTIVKNGDRWAFENPGYGDVGETSARRLLLWIENLKFSKALGGPGSARTGPGFDKPFVRLSLYDARGALADRLTVGSHGPDASWRFATGMTVGFLVAVDSVVVSELEASFDGLGAPRRLK